MLLPSDLYDCVCQGFDHWLQNLHKGLELTTLCTSSKLSHPLSYLHYTIWSVLSKLLPSFSGQLSSTKSHEWLQFRAICAPGMPSNPLSYLGYIMLAVFVKPLSHKVIDYSHSIYMTLKSNQWLQPPASLCTGYTGLLARRRTQGSFNTHIRSGAL